MKAIVIYYSKSGKTEAIAKKIQKDLDCDILKIEPAKEYGGFISAVLRARKEKKKRLEVPVKTEVPDLSAYDTVFLGYPIWMSTTPGFLRDFLKKCNFKDKMMILFCTSKKTSILKSIYDVKESCPGSLIKEGLAFSASTEEAYTKWMNTFRQTYM